VSGRALTVAVGLLLLGVLLLVPGLDRYCPSCVVERSVYPFTAMMTAYVTYAGFAAGLVLVASIGRLMGWLEDRWVSHILWSALGLLVAAWLTVLLDLGRPDHAMWLLLNWQSKSRVAWMPVFYAVLVLPLLIILLGYIRNGGIRLSGVVFALMAVASTLLELNLGSVFGFAVGVPAWHGLYSGFSFLVAGIAGGAACAAILAPLGSRLHGSDGVPSIRPLAGLALGAVLLYLIIDYWRLLQSSFDPGLRVFFDESGSYVWLEWLLMIAALVLFSVAFVRRSYSSLAIASIILLASLASAKYGFIIHGEEARLAPWTVDYLNPYAALYEGRAYHVSSADAAAITSALLIGLGLFILGEIFLALEPGEKPARLLLFRAPSRKP